MKSLEGNKILAGVLLAFLVVVVVTLLSESVFAPDQLEKQAYVVEGVTQIADNSTGNQPKKPKFLTGEAFEQMVAAADAGKGAAGIRKCTACHTFEKDGKHRVGPALFGTFDRKIASAEGYSYSKALLAKDGNWDIEALNEWLYNPRAFASGNKMAFAGMKNDQQRAEMIAYLKSLQ